MAKFEKGCKPGPGRPKGSGTKLKIPPPSKLNGVETVAVELSYCPIRALIALAALPETGFDIKFKIHSALLDKMYGNAAQREVQYMTVDEEPQDGDDAQLLSIIPGNQ